MLRFRHGMYPRRIQAPKGSGGEGRLKRLRLIVTGLIRYERVEPYYGQADEARQYAERLLYLAIKNGDRHKETMDLADFWLLEKDLVHKLFKVLVPRYQNYRTCFTDLHKLPGEYPGRGKPKAILELRGNPWPPVIPKQRETRYLLSNILLAGARKDYHISKQQALEQQQQQQLGQQTEGREEIVAHQHDSSTSELAASSVSSSVDSGLSEMDDGDASEVGSRDHGSSVDGASPTDSSSNDPSQNLAGR